MPPKAKERVVLSVRDPSEIRSLLVQLRKEEAELRLVGGLVEHIGKVTRTDKDGFEAAFPSLAPSEVPSSDEAHPLSFRAEFRKYFHSFDAEPRGLRPAERGVVLSLAWPHEVRKTTERALRVRPLEPATFAVPAYSPTALRNETASFFGQPKAHEFLLEADRVLASRDELALASLRGGIEEELRRLSGCDPLRKRPDLACFRFVTRPDDPNGTLDRVAEMWVQDVRLSNLPVQVKEHYLHKGIASFVLTVVTNQFLERDAYLFLARPPGGPGFGRTERDYAAALARRLFLCVHGIRELSFRVRDLGEDGLAFHDPEGVFAGAPAGTVLRDCGLSLSSGERLRVHWALVRSQRDLRAGRTEYPDYASRLRVRNFVESTLQLKRRSGRIF